MKPPLLAGACLILSLLVAGCSCDKRSRILVINTGDATTILFDELPFAMESSQQHRFEVASGPHILEVGPEVQEIVVGKCKEVVLTVNDVAGVVTLGVLDVRDLD